MQLQYFAENFQLKIILKLRKERRARRVTEGREKFTCRIHNVQFGGNNDMGGPTGCLQYYTGEMGTVNSFNWNGVGAGMYLPLLAYFYHRFSE